MTEPANAGTPRRHQGAIRAPQNLVGGIALMVVGAIVLGASAGLAEGRFFEVGPALLPRVVGICIGLIGAAFALAAFLWDGEAMERWPWRGPLFVFLGVLAFAASIRTAGLVIAGPLVALIAGAASPDTRPKELILFAVIVTAVSVALFRYVLHLPIPILIIPGFFVL